MKYLEIAKSCGARVLYDEPCDIDMGPPNVREIRMTKSKLHAYTEQVCKQMVEALEELIPTCHHCGKTATMNFYDYDGDEYLCDEHEKDHFYAHKGKLSEYDEIPAKALAAHKQMMGDLYE